MKIKRNFKTLIIFISLLKINFDFIIFHYNLAYSLTPSISIVIKPDLNFVININDSKIKNFFFEKIMNYYQIQNINVFYDEYPFILLTQNKLNKLKEYILKEKVDALILISRDEELFYINTFKVNGEVLVHSSREIVVFNERIWLKQIIGGILETLYEIKVINLNSRRW